MVVHAWLRANGAYFEQLGNGWDENGNYFGRVRVVHAAHRGEGEFCEWTVFRERRSKDPLPQYYSEVPTCRLPPEEVSNTNHPWLTYTSKWAFAKTQLCVFFSCLYSLLTNFNYGDREREGECN